MYFQKIYGLGNVKLKIKWRSRLEKTKQLVENVKVINKWYYTLRGRFFFALIPQKLIIHIYKSHINFSQHNMMGVLTN